MRNQEWLENRLEYIFRKYFSDVDASNQIETVWGRRSRRQLGCIKKAPVLSLRGRATKQSGINFPRFARNDKFRTIIVINGLFKDEAIPEFVIDAVIIHEFIHYVHGFNSPLDQKYRHPHKGNIIRREFLKRGIGDIERAQKNWIKENWQKYLEENFPAAKFRRKSRIRYKIIWK